jgi:type I restriction enzyme R subunit
MYDYAESGMNGFEKEDIEGAIFGPIDEKNKLANSHDDLVEMFKDIRSSTSSDIWQKSLADEQKRKEFYNRLIAYASRLNLAVSNRKFLWRSDLNRLINIAMTIFFIKN